VIKLAKFTSLRLIQFINLLRVAENKNTPVESAYKSNFNRYFAKENEERVTLVRQAGDPVRYINI